MSIIKATHNSNILNTDFTSKSLITVEDKIPHVVKLLASGRIMICFSCRTMKLYSRRNFKVIKTMTKMITGIISVIRMTKDHYLLSGYYRYLIYDDKH